ncbi:TetR/AcrR family transcriptional regulator [Shewanella sp. Scap07]|uniref:TetR/AcrR family transcriptional regulator n=1 Tax=Shewanella sp. Scap07 TaxID=2589987 RepID=UPI0015BA4331|nr:TetR/AcrR family transcriptional regulator [Shewanella sp. Scap07]QLE86701.1 TetR/AcrR family transcriptional regulator [Shewanella sp. Scap07]
MRQAEFDRQQVLRSAMTAFSAKGYSKTSMQDLTKATGLHPGSIYCAFENKRGLLLASLEQYRLDRNSEFEQFFDADNKAIINLKHYLDFIVSQCLSCDTNQACLLTKALNEIAEQDEEVQQVICSHLTTWQQAIAAQIALAQSQGDISPSKDTEHLGRYIVMGIYGLRTFAHTHPKACELEQLAAQLLKDICANR